MTTALHSPHGAVGSLDALADRLASHLLDHTSPRGGWTHERLVLATLALVRRQSARAALDVLLTRRPDAHVTRTVFMVWAVDRLVGAGLRTAHVVWHPLVDHRSLMCWWDADTLDSVEAQQRWVPPTLCGAGEPAPEPTLWSVDA